MGDRTATVEIELVSPLPDADLAGQFRPVVTTLHTTGVAPSARCVAADGTLRVRLDLERGADETLAELAVRGTSALLTAMRAVGVPPRLYTEKSVHVAEPAP